MGTGLAPGTGGRRVAWRVTALVIALIVAWPLAYLLMAWTEPQPGTWEHLRSTVLPGVAVRTGALLLGVGGGVLVLGVGLAWLVTGWEFPGRRVLERALVMPLAMPAYVLAFVYLGLLDYSGPVQGALRAWFGPGHWFPSLSGPLLVSGVLTLAFYPYVYLLARGALLSQGRTAEEAARTLGYGRLGAFLRAALPLARPAIVAGLALALMETLADFGAVAVFNYDTFTIAIYRTWFGLFNLTAAAQLATLLLVLVAAALVVERRFRGQARFYVMQRAPVARPPRLAGWRAAVASGSCALVFALAFALPAAQLVAWAAARWDPGDVARFGHLLGRTLTLAGLAAAVTVTLGLLLVLARRFGGGALSGGLTRFAALGYAVPGTVLAVAVMLWLTAMDGYLMHLSGWLGVSAPLLTGGLFGLLLAYAVRFLALAVEPLDAALQRVRPSLLESARALGARGWRLVVGVLAPLLRPGLLAAGLLVVVEVMKEMPATLMLRPFGWDTLAVRIYELTSEGEWERAALPALLLVMVGLLPVQLLMGRFSR